MGVAESRSSRQSSDSNAQAVSATETSDQILPKDYQQQALLTEVVLDRHCDTMQTLMCKKNRKCRMHGANKDRSILGSDGGGGKSASSLNTRPHSAKYGASNSRIGNRSSKNVLVNRTIDSFVDAVPAKRVGDANGVSYAANATGRMAVGRCDAKAEWELWPPFSASLPAVQQKSPPHGQAATDSVLLLSFFFSVFRYFSFPLKLFLFYLSLAGYFILNSYQFSLCITY